MLEVSGGFIKNVLFHRAPRIKQPESSVRIANLQARILNQDLRNTKQEY
jgi:hypothetical protein